MRKSNLKGNSIKHLTDLERKKMWHWTPADRLRYCLEPKRLRIQLLIAVLALLAIGFLVITGVV